MIKHQILYIVFCAFSFTSCAPTDDNEKIFSCKIDGNLWIAETANEISGYTSNASMDLIRTGTVFSGSLDAYNAGSNLQIVLNNLTDTGFFPLTPNDSFFKGTEFTDKDGVIYKSVPGNQSFLKLTQFDTSKLVIATDSITPGTSFPDTKGSFNIIVQNSDGKMINITDGKFALSWLTVHRKN